MIQHKPPVVTPILVTGSHRSGTTWVGRIIAKADGVGSVIPEPFSLNHRMGVHAYPFEYWFSYSEDVNQRQLFDCMRYCIRYQYRLIEELSTLRSLRDIFRMFRDASQFTYHAAMGSRAIIKDPIAISSVEWLVKSFDMRPVILIRHPAAFVSSLKKANWPHPFSHFLAQPKLMERLSDFRPDIERLALLESASLIDQGIVLWNIINSMILEYRNRHAEWCYIRHEDISREPLAEFHRIFEYLDLDLTSSVSAAILASTSNNNDVEAKRQSHTKINSKANVMSWKRRLNENEINMIKNGTRDYWPRFYGEEDW